MQTLKTLFAAFLASGTNSANRDKRLFQDYDAEFNRILPTLTVDERNAIDDMEDVVPTMFAPK